MLVPQEQLITVTLAECNQRKNLILSLFLVISLSSLLLGSVWPKKYTSFSTIHVDTTNILQPLMRGAAETTQAIDHVANAREVVFGEIIMDQIVTEAGWLETATGDVEIERVKENIKQNVKIRSVGENLLRIQYTDKNPERTYITTKRMAELFINEGEKSKVEESQSAYDFINAQVNEYLEKLTKVEEELREFRSNNPDARPGLETEVSNSITRLQRALEQAELELRETNIKKESLLEQLSGEAAITISQSREGQYRTKIADLQSRVEILRLDYQETYPDIVRLRHQIEDIKQSLNDEIANREKAKLNAKITGNVYMDEAIILNPFYQELRSSLSNTETEIVTLKTRIQTLNKNLEKEYGRAKKIFGGEAKLSKLTRDYQVNQDIYQDLLRRLENARVSKHLDEQQQGLTYKIQEPAKIPLIPTGVRFLHFALAGILLGVSVPLALIYFLIQVDPRIRFSEVISTEIGIPVLADIQRYSSPTEIRAEKINLRIIYFVILIVMMIYGYVGWLKFIGQI